MFGQLPSTIMSSMQAKDHGEPEAPRSVHQDLPREHQEAAPKDGEVRKEGDVKSLDLLRTALKDYDAVMRTIKDTKRRKQLCAKPPLV